MAALALSVTLALAGPGDHYDEIRTPDGAIRPHYQKVIEAYQQLTPQEREQFKERSLKLFLGDQALDPLPRVLTTQEAETLKKGVIQRGTALRLFLEDYFSGGERWKKVIPPEVLARVISRTGEEGFLGKVDPKNIRFPYGPDIIRDPKGNWRVLEDNPGNIGGPGDIVKGREILLEGIPAYREALTPQDQPEKYFKNLISRYRKSNSANPGVTVLYTLPLTEQADKEDVRLRKIYSEEGVEYVTPNSKDRRLVTDSDGVWLEKKSPNGNWTRERVGFIAFNGDHKDLDRPFFFNGEAGWIEEAKEHLEAYEFIRSDPDRKTLDKDDKKFLNWAKRLSAKDRNRSEKALKKALIPDPKTGKVNVEQIKEALKDSHFRVDRPPTPKEAQQQSLIQAVMDGKVESNYTPGLDFIGDKEFNAYADGLVELYLKEKPILTSISSYSFAKKNTQGKAVADIELLNKVLANKDQWVIKMVDGRGGDGIWVGPKVSQAEFESAKAQILKEPWRFRVQEYAPLSVLDDRIVDLRLLSYVDPKGVLVSDTPWGRAISKNGDGKVNISSNGFESPVVVVKSPSGGAPRNGTKGKGSSNGCLSRAVQLLPTNAP